MKTFFALLLTAFTALAQTATNAPPPNYAVKFHSGTNWTGPTYWPKAYETIGTNTVVEPGWTVYSESNFLVLLATNKVAFDAWHAQQAAINAANLASDLADFNSKLDKIESWIDKTSGTNSLNNAQRDNAINDVCQAFKKLRKVLVKIYQ